MKTWRQFIALLRKNVLLQVRYPGSLFCGFLLPLGFILVILAVYNAFPFNRYADTSYADSYKTIPPFGILPFRLNYLGQKLAVVPRTANEQALVAQFVTDMSTLHPPMNLSALGRGSFQSSRLNNLYIPGFADVVTTFSSEAALESYITKLGYDANWEKDSTANPKIWGAIVFNGVSNTNQWDYSIRLNVTQTPSTSGDQVDVLERGYVSSTIDSYLEASLFTRGPPFLVEKGDEITTQKFPGFLALQREIDRWIINTPIAANALNETMLVTMFAQQIRRCLPYAGAADFPKEMARILQTNYTLYQDIARDIRTWLKSETFAPQQVDFVPFPVAAYNNNDFYGLALNILSFILVIAYIFPTSRFIRLLVLEKETKMREGMRMMGVSEIALFASYYVLYAILYHIPVSLIIAAITTSKKGFFSSSSFGIVFVLFWVWGLASSSLCLLISVFFSKAKTAATLGVILFIAAFFPTFSVTAGYISTSAKRAASLLAPTAFGLGLDILGTFEENGSGVTSETVNAFINNWSVGSSIGMLVLDTFLYAFLAWYIDNILPASIREYGVPRKWYFPVTKQYWQEVIFDKAEATPSSSTNDSNTGTTNSSNGKDSFVRSLLNTILCRKRTSAVSSAPAKNTADASFFEDIDNNLRSKQADGKFASVKNLRKEFDTPDGIKVAVDGISFDMYEGQIFCLLGHNGAGKSTAISMMTGLIPPTDGTFSVYGYDIRTQINEIRKTMGVCPQYDVLWPELTVYETLSVFAEIKGIAPENKEKEIAKVIQDVGLTEKVNVQARALSGGMKRKLCVCMALMGKSKLIFLDEATSGMDPYSRRSTWQMLQNAREGRIIILTTHFMDEADILGDRIAIMAKGQVKCCGSPTFLKRKFGVGYILTLIKANNDIKPDTVLNLFQRHVPEASINTNVGAELSIRLPLTSASAFPNMLQELDAQLNTLGYTSYGISITSIEDVFVKIADDSHDIFQSTEGGVASTSGKKDESTSTAITLDISNSTNTGANNHHQVNPVKATPLLRLNTVNPDAAKGSSKNDATENVSTMDVLRKAGRTQQSGIITFLKHTQALFTKRWRYSKKDWRAISYQLLLPAVLIAAGLGLIKGGSETKYPSYEFSTAQFNANNRVNPNLPVYPNYVPYFGYKSANLNPTDTASIATMLNLIPNGANGNVTYDPRLTFNYAGALAIPNTYNFIQPGSKSPNADYQRMSSFLLSDRTYYAATKYGAYVFTQENVIIENPSNTNVFPESTVGIFVNTSGRHTPAVFMNLYNSALYKTATGSSSAKITARNHPLPKTEREATLFNGLLVFSAAIIIIIAFAFVSSSTALFIVKEKEISAKHQQMISGVSIYAYWVSNLIWDLLAYTIPAAFAIALCAIFGISEFMDAKDDRVAALVLNFVFFGMASVASTYLFSFFFKSASAAQTAILFINVFAVILISASQFLSQLQSACKAELGLRYVFRLLPSFAFGYNLVQLSFLTQLPLIEATCDRYNGIIKTDYSAVNALDLRATGLSLIYMAAEGIVYFLFVLAIEYILSQPQLRMKFKKDPKVPLETKGEEDADVLDEMKRVEDQVQLLQRLENSSENISTMTAEPDAIVVSHLRKVYDTGKVAVRDLSFGLPKGTILGYLGLNGAGKSTTLQILSGDILPTEGTAKMAGYDILTNQQDVRRLLGYCPQHEALLDLLSVREHLELYGRIKGVSEKDLAAVVLQKMQEFDLVQYEHKLAGSLSGGNKRKLSVAIAVISDPPILFLDEPSSGMDVVAKRYMWKVISRIATEQKLCSIILTTHSMEEAEALSTRIGIMVGGRLRCLGTPQHLRTRHGNGYLTEIKLYDPTERAIQEKTEEITKIVRNLPSNGSVQIDVAQANSSASTGSAVVKGATTTTNPSAYVAIQKAQLAELCTAMGNAARFEQISENGNGWAIAASLIRNANTVPVHEFAAWWLSEERIDGLIHDVTKSDLFPGSVLLERQGLQLRFRIPYANNTLSSLFGRLEGIKEKLGIASYTLGQTSLEQIFVQFASEQEEEKGVARGFIRDAK